MSFSANIMVFVLKFVISRNFVLMNAGVGLGFSYTAPKMKLIDQTLSFYKCRQIMSNMFQQTNPGRVIHNKLHATSFARHTISSRYIARTGDYIAIKSSDRSNMFQSEPRHASHTRVGLVLTDQFHWEHSTYCLFDAAVRFHPPNSRGCLSVSSLLLALTTDQWQGNGRKTAGGFARASGISFLNKQTKNKNAHLWMRSLPLINVNLLREP